MSGRDERPDGVALGDLTVLGLLALFNGVLEELRSRGVTRSDNNPTADYAEHLVTVALGLKLASRSNHGFDAEDDQGGRYEIKARRVTRRGKSPPHFGVIRGLQDQHFDYFVGIVFERDFTVRRGLMMPHEIVSSLATYKHHTNGWRLVIDDRWRTADGAVDVTDRLRAAQHAEW